VVVVVAVLLLAKDDGPGADEAGQIVDVAVVSSPAMPLPSQTVWRAPSAVAKRRS
jgi:hypothetical protein